MIPNLFASLFNLVLVLFSTLSCFLVDRTGGFTPCSGRLLSGATDHSAAKQCLAIDSHELYVVVNDARCKLSQSFNHCFHLLTFLVLRFAAARRGASRYPEYSLFTGASLRMPRHGLVLLSGCKGRMIILFAHTKRGRKCQFPPLFVISVKPFDLYQVQLSRQE